MKEFQFSSADRKKLYGRFHTMKNKAKNAGIPFHWDDFEPFMKSLAAVVEPNYSAATHRVRFDLERKDSFGRLIGYTPETLTVSKTVRSNRSDVHLAREGQRNGQDRVFEHALKIYHLLVNGFEGSLEELIAAGKP